MHYHFQAHKRRLILLGRLLAAFGERLATLITLPDDAGERRIVEAEADLERLAPAPAPRPEELP